VVIEGISIVNGAQTTGAIGSLKSAPNSQAMLPIRFIKTTDKDVIYDIIRYNNSQNKVTAPDFRSTDRVQRRLKKEMANIPSAEYEGGRRGGHEDLIRRKVNMLPSYTVGQALAAFHGDPIVAYNQKSDIWISDNLYAKYFNENTTAAHIVFSYSLLRAVENRKIELINKVKEYDNSLTASEQKQLEFFRNRGATYLLVSGIASCCEIYAKQRIEDSYRLGFTNLVSPKQAEGYWREIVLIVAPFCTHLSDAISDGLKNADKVRKVLQTFQSLVEATAESNSTKYREFASHMK